MGNPWPAIISGIALVALAAGLAHWEWKAFRGNLEFAGDDAALRLAARRRLRRRWQIAAQLALIGILIPIGDQCLDVKRHPEVFGFFWLGVLLLVGWMILLAIGDMLSVAAQSRVSLSQLEQSRRELEVELDRLRKERATKMRQVEPK